LENRPRVALDLDCTLYDFRQGMIERLKYKHGVLLHQHEWTTPGLPWTKIDHVDRDMIETVAHDHAFYHSLKPLHGALSGVSLLAKHFDLIAVTGRPSDPFAIVRWTRLAIERDFPGMIHTVHHTDAKLKCLKDSRTRIAVDDQPRYVKQFSKHRIWTWMIRTPHGGAPMEGPFLRIANNMLEAAHDIIRMFVPQERTIAR
jgi:5'(3')-deoxyribonucleotidase